MFCFVFLLFMAFFGSCGKQFIGYNFGIEDGTESKFCTHKELIVLNMFKYNIVLWSHVICHLNHSSENPKWFSDNSEEKVSSNTIFLIFFNIFNTSRLEWLSIRFQLKTTRSNFILKAHIKNSSSLTLLSVILCCEVTWYVTWTIFLKILNDSVTIVRKRYQLRRFFPFYIYIYIFFFFQHLTFGMTLHCNSVKNYEKQF